MPPAKEDLDRALKAFKKRLKVTRRDNESSYGGGPLSSGKVSGIVAVAPPDGFAQEIWDELVRIGKLKRTQGQYTYELIVQPQQGRS